MKNKMTLNRKNYKMDVTQNPVGYMWLTVLIAELLYIYFMPWGMIYSDYDVVEGVSIILTFLMIFGLIPYTIFITVKSFGGSSNMYAILPFLSILITGPTFGLYHDYIARVELKEKGTWTKGVVTDDHWHRGTHNIKCAFIHNGMQYKTSYLSDNKNIYKVGDTLDIIYSKEYPKMNFLEYNWSEN